MMHVLPLLLCLTVRSGHDFLRHFFADCDSVQIGFWVSAIQFHLLGIGVAATWEVQYPTLQLLCTDKSGSLQDLERLPPQNERW